MLVLKGNAFYEIDEECLRQKQEKDGEQKEEPHDEKKSSDSQKV